MAAMLDGAVGPDRFARLLAVCGFDGNSAGFVAELAARLQSGPVADWRAIHVNGVSMPHSLLLAVLEALDPGDRLVDVSSVQQLERLLGRVVPEPDRAPLQEVLDRYPVRLSQHSLRQMRLSEAVGRQYLPFVDELDSEGLVHTWVGQFHSGVVERMYRNRVIMILNMSCPVYCRFCFRKHKECRQERPPTRADVVRGVQYVRSCPEIVEVVLTGGDPFMNRANLSCAVEGLLEVDHVRTLRLATRSLSYHPALFTQHDGFWLRYLADARREAARRGKRIEIATHFIHPDELSLRSLDLISELTGFGIVVYVQTPLLGGINDGDELAELCRRLRGAGAEMHYVFMPCSPLQGNRAYRSTIDDGMRLAAHLRATLSDRAMPRFCTATAFGKIDWGTSGWAVEEDSGDRRFLWLRTPYTLETFDSFTPDLDLSGVARHNAEGTLDARFMVEISDRRWLRGPRSAAPRRASSRSTEPSATLGEVAEYRRLERKLAAGSTAASLQRVHLTRAEVDCSLAHTEVNEVVETLAGWDRVTDVVLWSSGNDPLRQPRLVERLVDRVSALPRITAVRVRSRAATTAPEKLSHRSLEALISRNRLGAVAPLRLELELGIVHHGELTSHHRRLADRLREHGVTVYNTSVLLSGINVSPREVRAISSTCREHGIEVHHLVVAGDPAQQVWNSDRPIHVGDVVDIASELRRIGGGRELPRFVIQTALGEGDFGVTAEASGVDGDGRARVRLLPYTVTRNGSIEPWGVLPEGCEIDPKGHPVVVVPGLAC
jgi:L-lysine 2,3-aminomutase